MLNLCNSTTGVIMAAKPSATSQQVFLISTIGTPTVLMAMYGDSAPLPDMTAWNWTAIGNHSFTPGSALLPGASSLQLAFSLPFFLEFDDGDENAVLAYKNVLNMTPLNNLQWNQPKFTSPTTITLSSSNKFINLILTLNADDGDDDWLPHLPVTAGSLSVQVEMIMDNYIYSNKTE